MCTIDCQADDNHDDYDHNNYKINGKTARHFLAWSFLVAQFFGRVKSSLALAYWPFFQ